MADGRLVMCDLCKKSVPSLEIRYVPRGKDGAVMLCNDCREKKGQDVKLQRPSDRPAPQKKSFMCHRCKYKFRFDPKGVSNLMCPYCGETQKITDAVSPSAEELLDQADNWFN